MQTFFQTPVLVEKDKIILHIWHFVVKELNSKFGVCVFEKKNRDPQKSVLCTYKMVYDIDMINISLYVQVYRIILYMFFLVYVVHALFSSEK